jgi:hypothetical protein
MEKEGRDFYSRHPKSGDIFLFYSPTHLSGTINILSQEHFYEWNKMPWVDILGTHTAMALGKDWFLWSLVPSDHCIYKFFEKYPNKMLIVESKIGGELSYDNVKSINNKNDGVQYTELLEHLHDYDSKPLTRIYHCALRNNRPLTDDEKGFFTNIFLSLDDCKYNFSVELFASAIPELRVLSIALSSLKSLVHAEKKIYCTQYNVLLLQSACRLPSTLSDNHGIPNFFSGDVPEEWRAIQERFNRPVKFTLFPFKVNSIKEERNLPSPDKDLKEILQTLTNKVKLR